MPPFSSSQTTLKSYDTKSTKNSHKSSSNNNTPLMPSHRRKSEVSLCNSDDDIGSIGSNTFRENKRREFADYENEDDEDLFNHHNNDVLQLFNNDHHNIIDD
eukprot:CAMPEP_0113435560 /NCGR_PEP_ID=MMETSP0013_2-20120614/36337_1 /TAXON_ID=2843 ORGANISM="Skeletonema costatum, Strain 1716" /NCGR_SAMPLE_ID=MMETSP0013_2 /ASSEMBLY_ACC=CAM_ASM_000158 /LENGTH=101 /DNA_ID=CAMNT_0000325935 /DNA_START=260 /DNA_END=562 /DNA_ORIENTATION=- /assembly_acc=CAM_ASM_000158